MSTQINIDNYESFYLDHLEGNLGAEDTAALLAFLEAHPELAIEDDALAYLPEPEFVALDNLSRQNLRFPDTEQKIGLNNIEIFLIASVENQLSEAKSKELQAFLAANPAYMGELSLYQRSRLQADLSIVFPDKKRMKKGGIIIPMYARFAAAAACVAAAVILLRPGTEKQGGNNLASNHAPEHRTETAKPGKSQQPAGQEEVHVIEAYTPGNDPAVSAPSHSNAGQLALTQEHTTIETPAGGGKGKTGDKEKQSKLKTKPLKPISIIRPLFHEPVDAHEPLASALEQPNESYALVDMKNPIQPITKRISEVIRQEVDFKTSKAAKKKSGGFYLKIGKFELSRKMYDNSSVAAK